MVHFASRHFSVNKKLMVFFWWAVCNIIRTKSSIELYGLQLFCLCPGFFFSKIYCDGKQKKKKSTIFIHIRLYYRLNAPKYKQKKLTKLCFYFCFCFCLLTMHFANALFLFGSVSALNFNFRRCLCLFRFVFVIIFVDKYCNSIDCN